MADWRYLLQCLVRANGSNLFPLLVYKVDPPQNFVWPDELPVSTTLRDFYGLCDGGYIDEYNWLSSGNLSIENARFVEDTKQYYPDNTSPLIPGRHIVLANDAGGAPLIWDKEEDKVSTFWLKGGDWEPMNLDMETFLENLFEPTDESNLWFNAVQQLKAM